MCGYYVQFVVVILFSLLSFKPFPCLLTNTGSEGTQKIQLAWEVGLGFCAEEVLTRSDAEALIVGSLWLLVFGSSAGGVPVTMRLWSVYGFNTLCRGVQIIFID